MKLNEIIVEAQGVEYLAVHNHAGIPKKFKKIDGWWEKPDEVEQWLNSRANPAGDRAAAKAARALPKPPRQPRAPKIDLQTVYNKVISTIGEVFPDGDPIDYIAPWLERHGIENYNIGDIIDKAMRRFGHGREKKGMYAYMADMWDSMTGDAMHDAKMMLQQDPTYNHHSPFVEIEDGVAYPADNPWR
jgi:hypothetical protein